MTEHSPGVQQYIERGKALEAERAARRTAMRHKKFDTIAVHGVYDMQTATASEGSIIEPVYLSSAEHYDNSDHLEAALSSLMPSWIYTRIANPTIHYLEETLALLEGYRFDGEASAFVTASGNAAVFLATVPFLSHNGQPMNIVAQARCYGGTFQILSQRHGVERGVEVRWVRDPSNLDEWASQIDANTRFLYGEMPSNPSLTVLPIAQVAAVAHAHGLPLIVDATIATPALMRPLEHGADVVVHSLTKSIASGGHSMAGAVIARHGLPSRIGPDALRENFAHYTKRVLARDYGPSLSPLNALMVLNDLRTLRHRMDFLSRNSMTVARYLEQHPKIEAVLYPGLESFEGYTLAQQQMWLVDGAEDGSAVNRYGHLMSFMPKGGVPAARKLFDAFQMIWRATDLGRIKSIATIPAISTHQQQGETGRDLAGIPAHLIRFNIGGEHPDDIIADLEQALDAI